MTRYTSLDDLIEELSISQYHAESDLGVPDLIRSMSASDAVVYIHGRGWMLSEPSDSPGYINYFIDHSDVNDIADALAEKKSEVLTVLRESQIA